MITCCRAGLLTLAISVLGSSNPVAVQFDPRAAVWHVRTTTHFDIYYAQPVDLDSVAREAERAYARVSRDQRRQLSRKVPLILLPTTRDQPRTEQEAAVIVLASGAARDLDHLLLAVEPREGRENRMAHELTHIFGFEQRAARPATPSPVHRSAFRNGR